jgi:hypothetical protein
LLVESTATTLVCMSSSCGLVICGGAGGGGLSMRLVI